MNNYSTPKLDIVLLDNTANQHHSPDTLQACFNSHGLYNNIHFVLRLSPKVHNKIATMPEGIVSYDFDAECLQAHSTYIHETIHWWQYCGSTSGLTLSLSYPSQTQANYSLLKKFITRAGPKKSVLKYVEEHASHGGTPDTPEGIANIIVNNHFDIEFYKLLISDPKKFTQQIIQNPLFESIGHSYHIAYASIIRLLAITFDESFQIFSNPDAWSGEFDKLRTKKTEGYYYGSNVTVSPLGSIQIFEGQARFSQLLYLYFAFRGNFSWKDAKSSGMMSGLYSEAFKTFLKLTKLEWPSSINHPIVGLFLLVCDVAMNPSAGFPVPITSFEGFITDVDPGYRFLLLCLLVRSQPNLAQAIVEYSKEEYIEVSEALTKPLKYLSPMAIAATVSKWSKINEKIQSLMREYEDFSFSDGNLTLKLMLSHFIGFNKSKLANPEFFCWPGAWMTGTRVSQQIADLFEQHSAPFLDRPDDDAIYPRLMKGKDEAVVQKSFDKFYVENICYDLSRQWIVAEGPFKYDYHWLVSTTMKEDIKKFADYHFEGLYNIQPEKFDIL